MEYRDITLITIGFLTCLLFVYTINYQGYELPLTSAAVGVAVNVAPSNWIKQQDIIIRNDMIILMIPEASISHYADTGSMKPVLDKGTNGIRIVPTNPEQINEGDIVSFIDNGFMIVHRVIEKGTDEQGTYYITKGDNTNTTDGKIRFKDIKYVTIGVLW